LSVGTETCIRCSGTAVLYLSYLWLVFDSSGIRQEGLLSLSSVCAWGVVTLQFLLPFWFCFVTQFPLSFPLPVWVGGEVSTVSLPARKMASF